MSKQDVMDYVLNSPHNTNPMVLASLMGNLGGGEPVVLYANSAEYYREDPTMGDLTLAAIQSGRPVLVRVPNADEGLDTAIYSPVLMYQLPNYAHGSLYLFYLRDEKQDLSAIAPGMKMPTYGELRLKLSKSYDVSPLEKDRVPLVERAAATLIASEMSHAQYTINYKLANFYGDRNYLAVVEYDGDKMTIPCAPDENGNLSGTANYSNITITNNGQIDAINLQIHYISIYEIINQ